MRNWILRRRAKPDGQTISVTDARGAISGTGTIWILIISTVLAVVLMLGFWAFNSRDLLAVDKTAVRANNVPPAIVDKAQ